MSAADHPRQAPPGIRFFPILTLCAIPLIAFSALQAMRTNANSPLEWVPATFSPRARYDAFVEQFEPGDTVIASWDGCTIENPQLDALLQELRNSPAFRDAAGQPLLAKVACGREAIGRLMAAGSMSVDDAVSRFEGTLLLGADGRTTAVIATFTPAAIAQRKRLVQAIQTAIEAHCGATPQQQHLAGPIIDGLCVDEAGRNSLDTLALPSALVVLLVGCVALGSIRMGLMVFGLSVFCQGATLAAVHLGGETMSALLIVLPPLVQVLAVAGGVHLANYYTGSIESHGISGAPWRAVELGWLPCVLSAGTTAIGIGSLLLSRLTPIRNFGLFGAIGVLLTAVLLLTLFPALLYRWPPRKGSSAPVALSGSAAARCWSALASFLDRHQLAVLGGCLLLLLAASAGLGRLSTSVRIETLFAPDSRILRDYRWLEARLGPLAPVEVVVSYDADSTQSATSRLALVDAVETAMRSIPEIRSTFSASELLLKPPEIAISPGQPAMSPNQQALFQNQAILAARPVFTQASRMAVGSDGREHWRITGYASALENIDYGRFLHEVRAAVHSALSLKGVARDGATLTYTGIMPLVHEIQRQLMRDLFASFIGACLIIAVVMMLAQRNMDAGLLAMIPNVFPTLLLFGLLGWAGMTLDIGTVMTASVALGIAVDDTLHYLTFFRRAVVEGCSRREAVESAYVHCGPAMLQTTQICALGLFVFGLSDFLPTQRFAWLIVSLLGVALACDLILLPTILLSPLGKCFVPAGRKTGSAAARKARYRSSRAASMVRPGPKANVTHEFASASRSRSRMNSTVGEDMLP